jgi:hypothetical protein
MGKVFCLPERANAPAAASHPSERDRVRAPNEHARKARGSAALFKTSPCKKENPHGSHRLFDRARREGANPHRALGDFLVNAKIIQLIPRSRLDHHSHEHSHPFRSRPRLDDLAMDHADTAPCEYASPSWQLRDEDDPA